MMLVGSIKSKKDEIASSLMKAKKDFQTNRK